MAGNGDGAASEAIRAQFARTAEAYARSAIHAGGDDLEAMVALADRALGGLAGRRVLDVATGAGHTAIAFAQAGAIVAALDLTPEMLDVARRTAAEALTVGSIAFHEGTADALPFGDGAFDAVTCRIAAHHFAQPRAFLAEARRVLSPSGRLVLVDNIAPEEPDLAEEMNRIERERDPSHVEAHDVVTWIGWLADEGFAPEHLARWHRTKDFADWIARSATPAEDARKLERSILALPDAALAYFGVREAEGRIIELQHEVMLLLARPSRAGGVARA